MTDLRDAARQALELLKELQGGCTDSDDGTVEALTVWCPEVIAELEAAFAQPEPIISPEIKGDKTQPERKPLTQEELKVMWAEYAPNIGGIFEFARAIEKAHGIE